MPVAPYIPGASLRWESLVGIFGNLRRRIRGRPVPKVGKEGMGGKASGRCNGFLLSGGVQCKNVDPPNEALVLGCWGMARFACDAPGSNDIYHDGRWELTPELSCIG